MSFDHFIAYSVLWVVSCVASVAGVGGGALILPIFLFMMDLPLLVAIPTTIACILGNSFVRATILYSRKHTIADTSLIDYTILWLLVPSDTIGSFVGAYLSNVVESNLLLWIVSVLTFLTAIKTFKKGYVIRKNQIETQDVETIHIDGISLQVLPMHSIDNNVYVVNDEARKGLFIYESIIIISSIVRVNNPDYDYAFILFIVFVSLFMLILGSKTNAQPHSSPNVRWGHKTISGIIIAGFCIGVVSTLVGVGGGMFVAPLLLYINTLPEVMASTNSFSTFFSAFATLFQYIVMGRVDHERTIFVMILSATAASIGLRIVSKSTWVIVITLGTLIFIASIVMLIKASLSTGP